MVIYSWNMFYENKTLDQAFEFIKNSPFDVFCLQEVPEAFLSKLKTLPYEMAYVKEIELTTSSTHFAVYSVTLSKAPILEQGEVSYANTKPNLGTLIIRSIIDLPRAERVTKWENRKSFFITTQNGSEMFQVFNLHLPLSFPAQRMRELNETMSRHQSRKQVVVCGDFNVLETFYIASLNWMFGGKLSDWFFYKRERSQMQKYFEKLSLSNPLKECSTHPISRSQLDHILVPQHAKIHKATVIKNRFGSDHNPIGVEIS